MCAGFSLAPSSLSLPLLSLAHLSLSLFQIWTGYSTLNLPTKEIAIWSLLISAVLAVVEQTATDFAGLNSIVRPNWGGVPGSYTGSVNRVFIYFYLLWHIN